MGTGSKRWTSTLIQLPINESGKAAEDDKSLGPYTHMGDPYGVPGCSLTTLVTVAIWGVHRQMEDLSLYTLNLPSK